MPRRNNKFTEGLDRRGRMMLHWRMHARSALLFTFLILLATQALLAALGLTPLRAGELVDPDCYMHLLRAEAWLQGRAGWFDQTIQGTNWPYGETLHWTRPFDLLMAAGALPLSAFMPLREALWLWGIAVSPALLALALLTLSWGTRQVLSQGGFLLLAALLCLLMPGAQLVFIAGRPDHHALQAYLLVLMLMAFLRERPALAGFAAGLALWVGGEGVPILLCGLAGLGFSWLDSRQEAKEAARRIALFASSLAAWTGLFLVLDRPPAAWLAVEYDRLSIVHLTLSGALAFAGAGLLLAAERGMAVSAPRRLAWGVAAILWIGGVMAALFPAFFGGPAVDIDPALQAIWLDQLSEAQPVNPFARGSQAALLLHLWPALMAVPFLVWQLKSAKPVLTRPAVWALLAAILVLSGVTMKYIRMAGFAQAASLLPWALLLIALMRMERRVWRAPLFLCALLGQILLASLVAPPPVKNAPLRLSVAGCSWRELADYLNGLGDNEAVLSTIYAGPEILFRTGRGVVATPYHRNVQGILDAHQALSAESDEAARAILERRHVGLVALCRRLPPQETDGLHARLLAGLPPSWLKPLTPPMRVEREFALYRVN
jgi:hypothetical protein